MKKPSITKAIFPVAGYGTRFLPITKTIPKEMLPIIDKPIIQYATEEAIAAGITQIIFVTSPNKVDIEDYFDSNLDLEQALQKQGKTELLSLVRDVLPENITSVYIRQHHLLGLGHAVLSAKSLINNEPFAVILPDDVMCNSNAPCIAEMIEHYNETNSSILLVKRVPKQQTQSYGIVDLEDTNSKLLKVKSLVEKPAPHEAPSDLAIIGRYIFTPTIFEKLEKTNVGVHNELQLTDGIGNLLKDESVYAYHYNGTHYDCGNKLGYLKANIDFALKDPTLCSQGLSQFLQEILRQRML